MDTASTGLNPKNQEEAEVWKTQIRKLTVILSQLPKQMQERSNKRKNKKQNNGADLAQIETDINNTLKAANLYVEYLPPACLYHNLVSTVSSMVNSQISDVDVMNEIRVNISKLNKLALNDQRALKRVIEFMDLRVQAGE
jgi:hypothetical protein